MLVERRKYCVKALILLCLVKSISCLYEDQVGKFDWRQQYIGKSKFVEFDASSGGGRRVIAATEQNVLASVNSRNGQLAWRQVFEKGDAGRVDDMVQVGGYIMVVLGGGSFVRCFSPMMGDLVWEYNVEAADTTASARLGVAGSGREGLAVLAGPRLVVLDTETGGELWAKDLPHSESVQYFAMSAGDNGIAVLGRSVGSHVAVLRYDETGATTRSLNVPAAWMKAETSCELSSGGLACAESGALHLLPLSADAFTSRAFSELGLSGLTSPALFSLSAANSDFLGLRLGPKDLAVLRVDREPRLMQRFEGVSSVELNTLSDRQVLLTLEVKTLDTVLLRCYDASSLSEQSELSQTITFPDHHGLPVLSRTYGYRRKEGAAGLRFVVLSADHSLSMVHQTGRVSWSREEALAGVLSVELVDLPVSPILAKMEEEFGSSPGSGRPRPPAYDVLGMFIKRFTTQFAQLKDLLVSLKHRLRLPRTQHHASLLEDVDVLGGEQDQQDRPDHDDDDYLTRDEFNLHKMIVAVTAAGKLFGLDSFTGRLVWRRLVPGLAPFPAARLPLYVLRTTAHFPLDPICAVLGTHQSTGSGLLFTFDPISGRPLEAKYGDPLLGYPVKQVYQVAQVDDHFLHPIVLLDSAGSIHVFPDSATEFVTSLADSLYMFVADQEGLTGFAVRPRGGALVSEQVWQVNLGHDGHVITNVVSKRMTEHVHSQGVVLGDRSVLYKYINPNLVAVTTESVATTSLSLQLVDAVSGRLLFHCSHKKARGPVHLVHSENWVVYTYWNVKRWRNEVAVLELYEGSSQSNATAFSSLSPPPAPKVVRTAFVFPSHVAAMATTLTERGMTNKHVLMALETGGILGMPKMLLDPRRPIVPTAEHKEEGLMPYIPELPRPAEAVINYNMSVLNVRAIHSAPAGLESTSLVLAYGLDLYYTRISPSKLFDVLKDDFDYLFIGSVLVGMVAVSILSRKLAARKALNRAWK